MNFPLNFRFKLFAIAPQIFVTDATGATVFYIKEKLFKLKETINIFSDESQLQQVATIQADRLMNWSARFNITDAHGQTLGSIGRQGFRSLWRAHYDLFDAKGDPAGKVSEENPMAKVFDYLLGEIPIVGLLAAYVFQPRYLLTGPDGSPVLRLHKRGSLTDRRFEVEQLAQTNPEVTNRDVLSLLMLVMLERHRK